MYDARMTNTMRNGNGKARRWGRPRSAKRATNSVGSRRLQFRLTKADVECIKQIRKHFKLRTTVSAIRAALTHQHSIWPKSRGKVRLFYESMADQCREPFWTHRVQRNGKTPTLRRVCWWAKADDWKRLLTLQKRWRFDQRSEALRFALRATAAEVVRRVKR